VAGLDKIAGQRDDNRDRTGGSFCRANPNVSVSHEDIHADAGELDGGGGEPLLILLREPGLDHYVLTLNVAERPEAGHERLDADDSDEREPNQRSPTWGTFGSGCGSAWSGAARKARVKVLRNARRCITG
jgi:hypothetical protein